MSEITVTKVKVLNKQVVITCDIEGVQFKRTEKTSAPPPALLQAVSALTPIADRILSFKADAMQRVYAFAVTRDDDGAIDSAALSVKVFPDGEEGISLALSYPRISTTSEDPSLILSTDHVRLLETAIEAAEEVMFVGTQLALFEPAAG